MLKRIFQSSRSRASGPEGLRIYAVGDVHGRADLLEKLLEQIGAEAAPHPKRLVFLGDYIDRGPNSAGVVERLIGLAGDGAAPVFLKGNHEAALLDFLAAPLANDAWLDWGGDETLRSYGVEPAAMRHAPALADDLRRAMPASHLRFYRSLPAWFEAGDYFFVHAGVRPGVPLAEQQEKDMLWIRGEFHGAAATLRPEKTIVHGHHPTRKPVDVGWRIGVDTGAVWSGVLTALVVDGLDRRFISVEGPPAA